MKIGFYFLLFIVGVAIAYQWRDFASATLPGVWEQIKNNGVQIGILLTFVSSLAGLISSLGNFQIARSNLKLTEDKLVTERLAKAFEQLESANSTTRLSAIYTLERIATQSIAECQVIIEILASFIRSNTPVQIEDQDILLPAASEAKAALTVIANLTRNQRLNRTQTIDKVDGSGFYLAQIALTGLNLRGMNLCHADLRACDLDGTDLEDSDLIQADFTRAYLGKANLRNTKLSKAILKQVNVADRQTKQSDFSHADLTEAELTQAQLSGSIFTNAVLYSADLRSANLREADLRYAILSRANFTNADLSQADLSYANLVNTKLEGADLYKARFIQAKISDFDRIKAAKNWETADYDPIVREKLGLL
ncbi:pentapeptide repeat-containing protein [Leptolyngbya sp. NIES-3755]|nr:pentapeptide repeat-containing protein [Leptolyngbya sp. NIES-3755]